MHYTERTIVSGRSSWDEEEAMGSEVLVQMFRCCVAEEDPSSQLGGGRRRIDRSMIGHPTDFRHTAHIGSGDLGGGGGGGSTSTADRLALMQTQMRSKGGYEEKSLAVRVPPPHLANARSLDEVGRK